MNQRRGKKDKQFGPVANKRHGSRGAQTAPHWNKNPLSRSRRGLHLAYRRTGEHEIKNHGNDPKYRPKDHDVFDVERRRVHPAPDKRIEAAGKDSEDSMQRTLGLEKLDEDDDETDETGEPGELSEDMHKI